MLSVNRQDTLYHRPGRLLQRPSSMSSSRSYSRGRSLLRRSSLRSSRYWRGGGGGDGGTGGDGGLSGSIGADLFGDRLDEGGTEARSRWICWMRRRRARRISSESSTREFTSSCKITIVNSGSKVGEANKYSQGEDRRRYSRPCPFPHTHTPHVQLLPSQLDPSLFQSRDVLDGP